MRLQKGDEATRTRDPGRGGTVGGGFVGGINGGIRHASVAVVVWAVVKFAVPAMFEDVRGAELVAETEDTVRTRFGGIKVILGTFEGSELFDRKVFREVFDREVGEIVGHSMCFWSIDCVSFNPLVPIADCTLFMDW